MKTTYITPEEEPAQRNRPQFVPVCQYGAELIPREPGEIGSICQINGAPSLERGLYETPVRQVECIIVRGA